MGAGYDTSFDPLPEIIGPSPFAGEGGLFGSGDMSGVGRMLAYSDASYTVQPGDNLSSIIGSSDPAAIGAVMRASKLSGSTIRPGQELILPMGGYSSSDAALGQAVLNSDNARLAALRQPVTTSTGFYGSLDMPGYSGPYASSTGSAARTITNNPAEYGVGARDFIDLLGGRAVQMVRGAELEFNAGYAAGIGYDVGSEIGFNGTTVSVDFVKGFGAFAGAGVSVPLVSRGQISGLRQALHIDAGIGPIAVGFEFEYSLQQRPIAYTLEASLGVGAGLKVDYATISYKDDPSNWWSQK